MPKLNTLKNNVLKTILRENNLNTSGTKTEMVQRLSEFLETDEIDSEFLASIDPEIDLQKQFDELKELVGSLVQIVKNNQSSKETTNANTPPCSVLEDHIRIPHDRTSLNEQQILLSDTPVDNIISGRNRFSVKEIAETIPEYDPTNDKSVSAEQFVQHVESAVAAYGFETKCLLLAVYSRLKGAARMWLDGRITLFITWYDFKTALLEEFGLELNEAEISSKMLNTTRRYDEKPIDYNFRMLALGNRFSLSEAAMVKYTRDGLRHRELQNAIAATKFTSMKNMRLAILEYEQNTTNTSKRGGDSVGSRTFPRDNIKQENNAKVVICYNCNDKGHISKDCPKPQKKERCGICQKTNHKTKECYQNTNRSATSQNVINKIADTNGTYNEVVKAIMINDKTYYAFLDSGSAASLIRENKTKLMSNTEKFHKMLTGFAGGKLVAKKMIKANVIIDGKTFITNLYVVPDTDIPEDVLLGRDILCSKGNRFIIEGDNCRIESMVTIIDNANGNVNENDELVKLLDKNRKCFADNVSELGKCTIEQMEIKLQTDEPVNLKPYRIAFAKREIVENILKELMVFDIIRPSKSTYASPVVLVEKKNGEHRLCVDYRVLNKITVKTPFPMPILEEQFSQLSGNAFFTTLDLRMGYYQVEMQENSKQYTAFITTDGHYEFNRMPFGLVNAPSVFQRTMNTLINQMDRGEALAYLDDVIIPSQTLEQGMFRLNKFLKLLTEHGLTLRRDKCKFFKNEVEHLGHIINKDGVKPGKAKISAIKDFPIPTNITEVRRFLGLTGFFRKFVLDYAIMTKPITKLLRKEEQENFNWTNEQQGAFELLISKLTTAPLLALYDVNMFHEVHTDACAIGLAGILLQSADEKSWRPVMYFSRHCTETEQQYHSYELEVLAVVETLERFRLYLLGKSFRLITDCAAIALTKEQRELKPRIARWWLRMQEYDIKIVHRAGSRLAHVDALSRAPTELPKITKPAGFIYTVQNQPSDWVAAMQYNDDRAKTIIQVLMGKTKSPDGLHIKREFVIKNQRLYKKEGEDVKLFVPKMTRWEIIRHFHDEMGHFAVEKTLFRIKQLFWFPKMRKLVVNYIKSCISCCFNKAQTSKPEGQLHIASPDPIPFRLLHIDHVGPFIRSKRGYSHILTISDAFTKFCILKPVKNTKTVAVINALNEIISIFGLPAIIVSDRGTAFTSKVFQKYCENYHISHVKNAVRTPRANGQVERANETLLNSLRCSTKDPKEWDLELVTIQWSINSQPNMTTKYSPNDLIFNYKVNDITNNHLIAAITSDMANEKINKSPEQKRDEALENINNQRIKWKERFDRKHALPTIYKEGDLIVLKNEPQATGESRKLEPKFRGPYMVAKILGKDRYVIKDIPGTQITTRPFNSVFASDLMKPWNNEYPEFANDSDDSEEEEDDVTTGETPECQEEAELSHTLKTL